MQVQLLDRQKLLRGALQGNALFSATFGVVIIAVNKTLVEFLGLPGNSSLTAMGVGLLGYAGWLFWNARREKISVVETWIAVILDMVWVAGSYVLLFAVRFSSGGKWLVVLVAELVFMFGVMQWLGLRKIGGKGQTA